MPSENGIPTLPDQYAPMSLSFPEKIDDAVFVPEVSRTIATLCRMVHVYACDGYQLTHDRGIDYGPRVGIVVGENAAAPSIALLMDNSRTVGDPIGTIPACPVYDELTEAQRTYLRNKPDCYYWAEWPPRR